MTELKNGSGPAQYNLAIACSFKPIFTPVILKIIASDTEKSGFTNLERD